MPEVCVGLEGMQKLFGISYYYTWLRYIRMIYIHVASFTEYVNDSFHRYFVHHWTRLNIRIMLKLASS